MDTWDQTKLEEVVNSKSGKQPPTDIVCKHFLEAIESSKYGWFWECPNGGTACKYRHALPPGFILKSKKSKVDEKEEISLEEFLESEVIINLYKGTIVQVLTEYSHSVTNLVLTKHLSLSRLSNFGRRIVWIKRVLKNLLLVNLRKPV